jgi:hypothetical protein
VADDGVQSVGNQEGGQQSGDGGREAPRRVRYGQQVQRTGERRPETAANCSAGTAEVGGEALPNGPEDGPRHDTGKAAWERAEQRADGGFLDDRTGLDLLGRQEPDAGLAVSLRRCAHAPLWH